MTAFILFLAVGITQPMSGPRPMDLEEPQDAVPEQRNVRSDENTVFILDGLKVDQKTFHQHDCIILEMEVDETKTKAKRVEAISRGRYKPLLGQHGGIGR